LFSIARIIASSIFILRAVSTGVVLFASADNKHNGGKRNTITNAEMHKADDEFPTAIKISLKEKPIFSCFAAKRCFAE
jgi:hypothetical protein